MVHKDHTRLVKPMIRESWSGLFACFLGALKVRPFSERPPTCWRNRRKDCSKVGLGGWPCPADWFWVAVPAWLRILP